jgi:hypothetical protein
MPTYAVAIGDAEYEVDAPNEASAWRMANQVHAQEAQRPAPQQDSRSFGQILQDKVQAGLREAAGALETGARMIATPVAMAAGAGAGLAAQVGQAGDVAIANMVGPENWPAGAGPRRDYPEEFAAKAVSMLGAPSAEAARNMGAMGDALSGLPPIMGTGPLSVGPNAARYAMQAARPAARAAQAVAPAVEAAAPVVMAADSASPVVAAADDTARMLEAATPAAEEAVKAVPKAAPKAARTEKQTAAIIKSAMRGDEGALNILADEAKINTKFAQAAQDLGINLPSDVFSDSIEHKALIGQSRAQIASKAAVEWEKSVSEAKAQVAKLFEESGAESVEGKPSLGAVSEKALAKIEGQRKQLESDAGDIYKAIDEPLPKETLISTPALSETLSQIKKEVGSQLSVEEKALIKATEDGEITYGALRRLKNNIGQALKTKTPYGTMDEAATKRLYGALAEDQLNAVESLAGPEARAEMRRANQMYAQSRAIGDRLVNATGKELEGSLAGLMRRAISGSAKAETKDFVKLSKIMRDLPAEQRSGAIMTAIADVTSGKSGEISAPKFAGWYKGIRANPKVFSELSKELGPDTSEMLRKLHITMESLADADSRISRTGASTQMNLNAIAGQLASQNLVQKVASTRLGRGAITAGGGLVAGPVGAAAASSIAETASKAPNAAEIARAIGDMLTSQEFQDLTIRRAKSEAFAAATAAPKEQIKLIKRLAESSPFRRFANRIQIPNTHAARTEWISAGLAGTKTNQQQDKNK